MWSAGRPIAGSPVDYYLSGRGCALPPAGEEAIRFLPDAVHWPSRTRHPAMLALITDAVTDEKMSLHLTFLRPDGSGKAAIEKPKLLLPGHQKAGGVIRLCLDEEVTLGLGLAEGIETTLSVVASGWSPAWAAVDAGNMRGFPVLAGVEALSLFSDRDPAGLAAAEMAAERWRAAGRQAAILPAPEMLGAA